MAAGRVRYSERGDAYVHELQTIMRQSHLDAVDDAMLLSLHISGSSRAIEGGVRRSA